MSEGFRAASTIVEFIVPQLREDFFLVDVGCSGGIDACFRSFGDRLTGVGFDPNVVECERLSALEMQRIKYESAFVDSDTLPPTVSPWNRLSVAQSLKIRSQKSQAFSHAEKTSQNLWVKTELAERRIKIGEYLAGSDPDFVKIDIDGYDYGVLRSVDASGVLGFCLEVNFIGGIQENEHTFHNTDRYMRSIGFELFFLSTRKYSIAGLPAKYLLGAPAQSLTGRPIQGDAIYFRDPAGTGAELSRDKTLKLAALMAMANQHDSAAELLIDRKALLDIDLPAALDLLAHEAVGRSYEEHIAAFEQDDASIYP